MMYMFWDVSYIFCILGAILCMIASANVNSTYKKYARVRSFSGLTGAQAAEMILKNAGITDVQVCHVSGQLTDHYDPTRRVVNLSDATYDSPSVAAVGVAAHECGHVVQHHTGYVPLKVRAALVPAANIGSNLGLPIVIIGLIFGLSDKFIMAGIWIFAIAVLFQIVTLPVEFDASHRALVMLGDYGMMGNEEVSQVRKVLTAAAMTYVAAAASSILQLLRLVFLAHSRDD
ncbi:MAG: zinc metallopeptidase [Lachnospiraceae bacterium]|jgi:Zn-dependent membrane protease YugP|nr:zinc metallopeptidase [Lachnospiraceae bacterium]